MSFNFSHRAEYRLNSSMIKEVIELYGVPAKFIKVDPVNLDHTIFKDYSHLLSLDSYDITVLPETSDAFETANLPLQDFGILNFDNITLFIHADSIKEICNFNQLVGNLIVLQSNKVMEITFAELQVPGINNLFTYDDAKSVYKLTCKPYDFKANDEIKHVDMRAEQKELPDQIRDFDALDAYFDQILNDTETRREETEVKPVVPVKDGEEITKKPIINKDVDDVWGQYF